MFKKSITSLCKSDFIVNPYSAPIETNLVRIFSGFLFSTNEPWFTSETIELDYEKFQI